MPWRASRGACGPGLPRAVTPSENSPRAIARRVGRQVDQRPVEEVDARQRRRHDAPFLVHVVAARRHVGVVADERERLRARGAAPTTRNRDCGCADSFTCVAGSIAPNANSAGIGAPSAKAVVVEFHFCLPVRRNRLLEIRQRLDARLPRAQLRREQSSESRSGSFDLAALHERDQRIEREVGRRQRAGEEVAAHRAREQRVLVDHRRLALPRASSGRAPRASSRTPASMTGSTALSK